MFPSLRQSCGCLCRCLLPKGQPGGSLTSIRKYENPNTIVFERKHAMQNCGIRKFPLIKKRHYVYNVLEHKPGEYKKTMKCILTKEVEDVGLKGTLVEVPKRLFRNVLYPRGDAVYASPENIELYESYRKDSEEEGIDYEIKQLMRTLAGFHLRVIMNGEEPWTLSAEHVKVSFRKMGVMLSDDNIMMPKKPVQKFGDFVFRVQMNNRIAVKIRGTVFPLGKDSLPDPSITYTQIWDNAPLNPAIFEFLSRSNTESELEDMDTNEDDKSDR